MVEGRRGRQAERGLTGRHGGDGEIGLSIHGRSLPAQDALGGAFTAISHYFLMDL